MFEKVLIANRGEIALRIHRACRDMGIKTVAVHSTADANAMNVRLADESVCIGPPPARASYLNIPSILSAATITGADAIHPGIGFLSENADFADVVLEHGFAFIGPKPDHIRVMGDKVRAKAAARELGMPTVPGSAGMLRNADEAIEAARAIGYPVLLKAVSGGGGRGMKLAHNDTDLRTLLPLAQAEAQAAFGDDSVYLERFLDRPRHIEIQLIGDGRGAVVHLGERDCSLQRHHQKILEETPSPGRISEYHAPGGPGIRVDSGLYQGYEVPPYYDSLISKLIVYGGDRDECLMRLRRALEEYVIGGIETTIPLHQRLAHAADFQRGAYDIGWLERFLGH